MVLQEELAASNNIIDIDGSSSERNELVYDEESVVSEELRFFSSSKNRIDTCMDSSRPSLAIGIEPIKDSFLDAKKRGVELRYLTEITQQNISTCKKLVQIVDEVRHLDSLKGNFIVSEKEYLAPFSPYDNTKPASRLFYSNLKEIVEQHQYLFEVLWNKAIPAQERIRELEEGIEHVETRVLENPDEIFEHIKHVIENASERLVCSSSSVMQVVYSNFFHLYKKIINKHRRGEGKGVRWITYIDKANKDFVNIFLNAGAQVRHIKNLPTMNFAVDNRYFHATLENLEDGKKLQSLLTSSEPTYIRHYNSVFEELWKNGIDAAQRIRDIEEGVDLADIEVIPRSSRARILYLELIGNVREEIFFIFPTSSAFIRQHKIGAIPLAVEAAEKRNVKIKILVPYGEEVENRLKHIEEGLGGYDHNLGVRYIEQMSGTKATILVVDRKVSLVMELRDDSKTTFDEAIGLSTYSNSRGGVLSYVAIFENLWKQTELYEEIRKAHEQLKLQDIMQKEFINIAAHELRTPIQPILGLTEALRSQIKDVKQKGLLEVAIRNAKRLQRLTNDILEVTKIEGRSLELNKEDFNLNDVVINAMNDIMLGGDFVKNEKIELSYNPQDILIQADKERISQVISNLLSNAIKSTTEGTILVSVERGKNDNSVIVSVKDSGQGIDPSILPRLFTKFATKSHKGTGLGLFISKGIIEAHGGRIWGKNNRDGIGAIFSFSLPAT